jgi:hypothetical protein
VLNIKNDFYYLEKLDTEILKTTEHLSEAILKPEWHLEELQEFVNHLDMIGIEARVHQVNSQVLIPFEKLSIQDRIVH